LYGVESWTVRKTDQKYMGSFEMWRWRRKEEISWNDRVRNKEVLKQSQGGAEYPAYNKRRMD
jgi:hypothetical protein